MSIKVFQSKNHFIWPTHMPFPFSFILTLHIISSSSNMSIKVSQIKNCFIWPTYLPFLYEVNLIFAIRYIGSRVSFLTIFFAQSLFFLLTLHTISLSSNMSIKVFQSKNYFIWPTYMPFPFSFVLTLHIISSSSNMSIKVSQIKNCFIWPTYMPFLYEVNLIFAIRYIGSRVSFLTIFFAQSLFFLLTLHTISLSSNMSIKVFQSKNYFIWPTHMPFPFSFVLTLHIISSSSNMSIKVSQIKNCFIWPTYLPFLYEVNLIFAIRYYLGPICTYHCLSFLLKN